MTYDYFTINFTSFVGFCFLLIFLYANASLDKQIKQIFYLTIFLEFIEAVAYSLELWTTTFATLSPLRLWLSAIGYSVSVTVTASMGAIYAGGPVLPGLEHLLYLSDVAMYEAKSAGRNCYVLKEL